ncbi:tetratricopeptide repeat protein [Kordiimonas sp. SCSIO 12603]|uniref:tetratricopeptide repeat protein n=1 Tax=Kordiimonas sp. SCSIO 12603 TaxID=2829596 RepID=UPI002104AC73|nr:tetratricopeptide repeat protein [Kordiimonas sp. SCSIO 12603]UTW57392.1 tetratricopeptide repeat protein [Kordiimonas sp. SCSIO 12603]
MIKILSKRINIVVLTACICACSSNPHPARTTQEEGIFSARARNELATENPEGLVRVGEGFEKSGNLNSALNLYGQALSAAPSLLRARIAYARVTAKLGQPDRALAMLDSLSTEERASAEVLYEKSGILISQRNYVEALAVFQPLVGKSQLVQPEHIFRLAKLTILSGEMEEGQALLSKAINQTPYNGLYTQNLAFTYALKEDFQTAISLIQQSLDRPEGKESGRYALALVYALSGQINQALEFHLGVLNRTELTKRRLFYRALRYLNPSEKNEAVFYGNLPEDIYERIN